MKKKEKIAVTGIGGGVGQSIIKTLYDSDYDLVGLDGDLLAAGAYALPKAYKIPYANTEEYIPRLLEICQKEGCKLLFPGLDAELPYLAKNKEKFEKIGTKVVVSPVEVIETSDDKLLTYSALTKAEILVPLTIDFDEYLNGNRSILPKFPLILKPRLGGARSKNVYKVKDQRYLDDLTSKGDFQGYVAQELIEGDEYTCGTVTLNGEHFGTIVMKRILRDGDTYKAFVEKNRAIEEEIAKVIKLLKPFGALNVQLRLRDGKPYIFELNARCSGTTASRALAGFNEPKMIADYLIQNKKPNFEIKEISILRYWKELVVENNKIDQFKNNGYVEINNPKSL
jgi:carbamoyl-phosphate synthase large subunit